MENVSSLVPRRSNAFPSLQVLRDQTRIFYDWGYMLAWAGVGWSLTAAILFSGAAICLRGEREREEAINMQYLMPGNSLFWGSIQEFDFDSSLLQLKTNLF